jgi:SAM-dependent methyltransferase/SOS-response transcriptional repressor LexA
MDAKTKAFYATHAERLSASYSSAGVAADLLATFHECRKILDLGCGSGRDLAALLLAGKDAYGADAVPEMLASAEKNLSAQGIATQGRLFTAELPDLGMFADAEFDGVHCSAVLMHLAEEKVFDAIFAIRRILKPGGRLRVSVPSRRADVDSQTRRDPEGRFFSDLAPAKLQLLLERVGFSLNTGRLVSDSLGRPGVEWWIGDFTRLDDAGERPLHLVESVLNRDKKDATYKLALFRALAEIAQTQSHLAAYTPEGKIKLPIQAIAEKWILYYWPIFESELFIPQRTNERAGQGNGVAIRKPLAELIGQFQGAGGLTGFYTDWKGGRLSGAADRVFKKTLRQLQSTIHTMPAKHAGGGHYDVFQYDARDKSLAMDIALWRELCLMGSWIRDATILRWAEQTEIFAKGAVKASTVIDLLLLAPDQGRNVNEAQKYFATLRTRPCVWSQSELAGKAFDVDHAMPFSYWRNNDLWNLFPASPEINAKKSDRLPTYRQLQRSRDIIVDYWRGLNGAMGERFQREAQTLLGRAPFQRDNWEPLLFSRFVEAFEVTANQRGAERWEYAGAAKKERTNSAPFTTARAAPSPVRYPQSEEGLISGEVVDVESGTNLISFSEVGAGAFKTHLPFIGDLAAGSAFHGIETGSLSDLEDVDWVAVPAALVRKNRFVVRVAGDSMEPTLRRGELAIFEYHRNARRDGEIVIANLPEFGADGGTGTETIKRLQQDAEHWIFIADNPAHVPIKVPKAEVTHPILGTFVTKV